MRNPLRWIGEQLYDVSRSGWYSASMSALRTFWSGAIFHKPVVYGTTVNYELARSLYRNDNPEYNMGAFVVKPMIDAVVEHMGLPLVSSDSPSTDAYLTECITDYWAPQLQQIFRDAMRDSKVIVRFRQPLLTNPLFTSEDRQHGKLELILPEEVDLMYDPTDPDLLLRAAITHWYDVDERTEEEIVSGTMPRKVTHEIIEIITPDIYRFYDKTAGSYLETWQLANVWGFVPIWEVWNEYETELGGGRSDIEGVLPFIEAFHEVMLQVLAAHEYHSTPKAVFNIKDIGTFIRNNFPEAWDVETNAIKPGAKVTWSGRQIFFMQVDEKSGFIEARSVLGDSKTLLEFLIDCISIASETPRWVLMKERQGVMPTTDAQVEPFERKVDRKRTMFAEPVKMIFKMALVATGKNPITVRVSWPTIRTDELVTKGQAIQQIILALDVAAQHQWIADPTVVKIIGSLFAEVGSPEEEMALAKKNVEALPAAAPASKTQAIPPPSSNGGGNKAAGRRAVATTAASRS